MHQPDSNNTIIFSHIPKAAGMTMRQIVARQFIGQPTYMFNKINGYDVEPFLGLPTAERAALRCINGHVKFGIHRYINNPCAYITLIRDPYEHLISTYFFFRKTVPDNDTDLERLFERYLQHPATPSTQLDWIVGYDTVADTPTGIIDNTHNRSLSVDEKLALAETNLRENFVTVGLVEHFDETLLMLRKKLGWKNIYYAHKHYNTARPRGENTARLRELIAEYAKPDLAFYARVKEMFEEQRREYGPALQADLRAFQKNNRIFSRIWSASTFVRGTKLYKQLRRLQGSKS